MRARPECLICAFRQAINTARVATDDPRLHMDIISRLVDRLKTPNLNQTPAALSQSVYQIISDVTGIRDPYAAIKKETNALALRHLPGLEHIVDSSSDPLKAACKLAIAGNIIDLGIGHDFDLERDVHQFLQNEFRPDAYPDFLKELRPGRRLLYLGDNSGEIIFDRVLVEHLLQRGIRVTFSIKSSPIINDATLEDAQAAGLTDIVPVITTGSDDIGVHWDHVSPEFRQCFENADFIISKGHANFETCTGKPGNIYFLLKTKCDMVADELGVPLGSMVFSHEINPTPPGTKASC